MSKTAGRSFPKVEARWLVAALALLTFEVAGATFYKHIDPKGRITYSDLPPRAEGGRVVPLDIDTSANVARQPPLRNSETPQETENERIIRRRPPESGDSALRAARARLEAARAALEEARNNSLAEDWIYLGRQAPGGQGGRFPRPEYLARLEGLEADAKAAEASLTEAERRVRLGPLFN